MQDEDHIPCAKSLLCDLSPGRLCRVLGTAFSCTTQYRLPLSTKLRNGRNLLVQVLAQGRKKIVSHWTSAIGQRLLDLAHYRVLCSGFIDPTSLICWLHAGVVNTRDLLNTLSLIMDLVTHSCVVEVELRVLGDHARTPKPMSKEDARSL
jgi:hypothetical protein